MKLSTKSDLCRFGCLLAISMTWVVLAGGCAEKQPKTSIREQPPSWIMSANVGSARKTASGSFNEQRMLALQRAIAEMLISSGEASGQSVVSVAQSLKIKNNEENYSDDFDQQATVTTTFNNKTYEIETVKWWMDRYKGILYVKIKEK